MEARNQSRLRNYTFLAAVLLAALTLAAATPQAVTTAAVVTTIDVSAPDVPAPLVLNYQGRLADPVTGAAKPDGTYQMTFALYDVESGGSPLNGWTETRDVYVKGGLFSLRLGELSALPPVFDGRSLWLGITVGGDPQATPRLPVSFVAYALYANRAASAGAATAAELAANSDRLGGQPPSSYAAASHAHDATNIVSGNLHTDRYHAIDDLTAEGFLGNATGDIALNNGVLQPKLVADYLDGQDGADFASAVHNHDATYVNVTGDSMSGTLNVSVPSGGSHGISSITASTASAAAGVEGKNTGAGYGILAGSAVNHGIYAWTNSTTAGIAGVSAWAGNKTTTSLNQEVGVRGEAADGIGVAGISSSSMGLYGYSSGSRAAEADGYDIGLYAYAFAPSPTTSYGLYARNTSTSGYAGYFWGRVNVNGDFSVSGTKAFKIDHPLDPANKYLYHFAVESPEVRNLYQGNVVLDASGEAVVTLPDYFDALNVDTEFNYQLTCVGGYAPVYIAEKIAGNQFKIAGGKTGLEVSWQVTAIRDDPYLRDHPVQVEAEKNADEKGKFQYPQGYGQPDTMASDNQLQRAPASGPVETPDAVGTTPAEPAPVAQPVAP